MHKNGTLLTADVCNPAFWSMATRLHGKQQFHNFIMDTYDKLYKVESKQLQAKSSIGVFVHFDEWIRELNVSHTLSMRSNAHRPQHCGPTD